MLIRARIFFLLLCSETILGSLTNNKLISAVGKFLDNFDPPVKVTAYVCWTKEDNLFLWRNLSAKHQTSLVTETRIRHGPPRQRLFIVDLRCDGSLAVLKRAAELSLFKRPFEWLLCGRSTRLADFYFGVDSQIYVMDSDSLEIINIYKYSPTSTGFVNNYVINGERRLDLSKRTNLMGAAVKVVHVFTNKGSLEHLTDYRDRQIDTLAKLNYILVNYLMDYLNATSEYILRETWGYENSTTGLYSGLVGDLQRGLADLGGTPLFFTPDRIEIIDYFASNARTFMKFIFKAPPLSSVTNVFTLPFDSSVWRYCLAMAAAVVAGVYAIAKWEWRDAKSRSDAADPSRGTALKPGFLDAVMFEISAVSQQGYHEEPKSSAGRIITIFTFLTFMFLYTSYSANIVALLQSTSDSINTLEDLLNSGIKLGVEDIVYAHHYFENAQEPIQRAVYEERVAPKGQRPNFMAAEEGMRRVREGFFAFHIELNAGYKIVSDTFHESEKCSLKEVEYVSLLEPYLAMQKNSVYGELFKIGMRRFNENGMQQRETSKFYKKKPQCHTSGSNFGSVGMVDCYSAFLLFGIGNVVALLFLLVEIALKKYSNRQIKTGK